MDELDTRDRNRFLVLGGLFEGGLAIAAIGIGWLVGIDPLRDLDSDWRGIVFGTLAAVPVFLLFLATFHRPLGGLKRIREMLLGMLGRSLAQCRWYHLALLALTAGVGEELLFRGFLQPWIEGGLGYVGGAIATNVAFGLAHAVTPTYAVAAGVIGGYLSWLLDATGERNLTVPIVTHAVYDFWAFAVVAREARRRLEREALPEQPPAE